MTRFNFTTMASALAGFAAMILLFPASGIDRDPPECYSVFDYVVPCADATNGVGFALTGAAVAASLVLLGAAIGRRFGR